MKEERRGDERGEKRHVKMKEKVKGEEKRKSREEKREEKKSEEERQDAEQRQDQEEMTEKMKRHSQKKVSRPSNPPDDLVQNVSEKNPSRTNYSSIFSAKVQNLTVFSLIYMIRIRFFGPRELIQNGFRAAQ